MSRWKTLWHLLNLPCRDATRLASQSLDGDLDRLERIALKGHLVCCLACRRYLRQIALLKRTLRRLATDLETGRVLPGPGLPDDVRTRIKQALRDL
jgi:predicted anti-sigma-YlaC factor YlaD